ncbi:MAG: DNA recombination protein RmuC [Rhodocyclaceae bacterium]|jgi:DNA recombination protein RmuC|nr:DNA recombination protein RmuC [Rhodocyclaceae bacterium]
MTLFDIVLLAALILVIVLLLVLLFRTGSLAGTNERLQDVDAALARLEGQVQMIGAAQEARLQGLAQATTQALETVRAAVDRQLAQTLDDARAGRTELANGFAAFRADIDTRLATMTTALREQLEGNGTQLKNQLSMIQQSIAQQLSALAQASQQQAEQVRATLNERLGAIQADNAAKLEEMRKTVDEKLHATLEARLGQSFQLVSERLEQVHRGLGEMQTLAAGVGDLKRVLTNVKARGTWGEVQLLALIEQMLTPEQYGRNVATRPGSNDRVEIAIRLPGASGERPVWLPIDAKFPVEDYQRLLDAHDRADADGVEAAAKALEGRLRAEARTIREKYVEPPFTTDFAVLYLPTEGLYAEALRRPGLAEALQREQRVVLAGPTNLAALLNSLQMGFRTLAIEKRASEVWQVLGQVKTEFGKFGEVIEATKKKLDEARNRFDAVGTRTRAIERKLRDVEALPLPDETPPFALLEEDGSSQA